jgi:hypothetical protein
MARILAKVMSSFSLVYSDISLFLIDARILADRKMGIYRFTGEMI